MRLNVQYIYLITLVKFHWVMKHFVIVAMSQLFLEYMTQKQLAIKVLAILNTILKYDI